MSNRYGASGKRVYLSGKCVKLENWWMDEEGTIGHDCKKWLNDNAMKGYNSNNRLDTIYIGRTMKGYNPIKGVFGRVCVNCGEDAPDWLEQHSMLRRLR
jgi:hypothetical protein